MPNDTQHNEEGAARTRAAREHLDAHHRSGSGSATAGGSAEVNRINPTMTQPLSPEARAEVARKQWSAPDLGAGKAECDPLLRGVEPGEGKLPKAWPSSVHGTEK